MRSAREVLKALESCFEEDEVETLVAYKPNEASVGGEAVKVVHKPSGREFVGSGHTQIQNKALALLQLLAYALPRTKLDA